MTLHHLSAYVLKSSTTTLIIPCLHYFCLCGPVSVMLKLLPSRIYNAVLFVILYLLCHYHCPNSPLPPKFPTLIVLFLWPCCLYNIMSLSCASVTDVLLILYIHLQCCIYIPMLSSSNISTTIVICFHCHIYLYTCQLLYASVSNFFFNQQYHTRFSICYNFLNPFCVFHDYCSTLLLM